MSAKPPIDPADHAAEFARTWVDRLEHFVEGRMHALDVHEEQIGSSDHERRVEWRTFFPDERDGGGVYSGGRISVDSGVLNPELLTTKYGEEASQLWARSRVRDRIDAIIIHELAEAVAGTHEEGLILALRTDRPISEPTRRIFAAMQEGWDR